MFFNMSRPLSLSLHQLRLVAVHASADARTVVRYLAGRPVRPMLAERIRAALASLGLDGAGADAEGDARPAA